MNIYIILTIAIVLSILFHFVGVYADAKKTVWLMLLLVWAGAINISMSEVSPEAYEDIEKMRGQFADTDVLIEEALPEISVYEMLSIKKNFNINRSK